jgi:hypothetical protein
LSEDLSEERPSAAQIGSAEAVAAVFLGKQRRIAAQKHLISSRPAGKIGVQGCCTARRGIASWRVRTVIIVGAQHSLFLWRKAMPTPRAEAPAVAELKRAIRSVIPSVTLGTIREDGSRHTSGLAIDIMLDSRTPDEKSLADSIISALVDCHSQVKWSDLIYTDWTEDGHPTYFHMPAGVGGYGGTPFKKAHISAGIGALHVNHIHLDWVDFNLKSGDPTDPYTWSQRARAAGFAAAFRDSLQGLIGNQSLPSGGAAPGWLLGWWKVIENNDSYYYYVGEAGYAYWTDNRPASPNAVAPLSNMSNRAQYAISGAKGVQFNWDTYGTVENFTAQGTRKMAGRSNKGTQLEATKI